MSDGTEITLMVVSREFPGSVAQHMQGETLDLSEGTRPVRAFVIEGGMAGGRASVMLFARKDDGTWIGFETSERLLWTLAQAARGAVQRMEARAQARGRLS